METNMGDCGATFSPRLHCNQDLRPQPPILKSGPHWTMYAAAGEGAKKKQNRKTGFWEIDLGEWKELDRIKNTKCFDNMFFFGSGVGLSTGKD